MRADILQMQVEIEQSLELLRRRLDWETSERRLAELNALSEKPDFWDNPQAAQKLMQERSKLETGFENIAKITMELADNLELAELAEMDDDQELLDAAAAALTKVKDRSAKAELEALLSGEADGNNCFVEIHPGAGGTEAQDWAEMILRMYLRWANARGMKTEIIEAQSGDEAGIKSATVRIKGENAFGWMKTESGVHRLVRISPYDSSARRHTSFASVWVFPEIDETIDIDIPESDVRTDTYRASGAGGQHVNKTDSAVRLTYTPPGETEAIVVQCQNDRSQHKNRSQAWDMLRARVYELEMRKREAEAQAQADSKSDIGWGHQIRSYVLQPYQMIKDLRTGVETSDTSGVLDGDLDQFMAAALSARVGADEDA
ncbi:peptide chain release factor 2 [Litorimonas sp. RW-G-Af-16]|uniref:peptide chain release factor 2 n=1 Tax=Litorimonas sp. RW-G-Af-16 TaxID=3241168 RepID=UPI00390C61A5